MSRTLPLVCLLTLVACRDRQVSQGARKSPVETAIARDLTARFGTSVTVHCTLAGAIPVLCEGALADGTKVPIVMENAGKAEWGWRIDGRVIEAKTIVDYVQGELAALKVAQTVTCTPSVQVVRAGERVSCTLSGGGAAFVQIAGDGSTTLELALDKDAAAARAELVTPERDRELTAKSKGLETLEGETDGEEAVPANDGGVPQP